jgi:hypothetical protein
MNATVLSTAHIAGALVAMPAAIDESFGRRLAPAPRHMIE